MSHPQEKVISYLKKGPVRNNEIQTWESPPVMSAESAEYIFRQLHPDTEIMTILDKDVHYRDTA